MHGNTCGHVHHFYARRCLLKLKHDLPAQMAKQRTWCMHQYVSIDLKEIAHLGINGRVLHTTELM
jgi:hypothetical protein